MLSNYQKVGILKYDAFQEMGGKLSFAITLLDGNNSGYIINSMHSREGCYTYIKEIVEGNSIIVLAEEEKEALNMAITGVLNPALCVCWLMDSLWKIIL